MLTRLTRVLNQLGQGGLKLKAKKSSRKQSCYLNMWCLHEGLAQALPIASHNLSACALLLQAHLRKHGAGARSYVPFRVYGSDVIDTYGHFAVVGFLAGRQNGHSLNVYPLPSVFAYIKMFLSAPVIALCGLSTSHMWGNFRGPIRGPVTFKEC